jgi:hypothetical protein
MKILSLCDYTGNWSKPYRDAGYEVIQVDLQHGQDIRLILYPGHVHGILAAPPCTTFASSGARWWAQKGEQDLLFGLSVADACLRLVALCRPDWWALENPTGRLSKFYGKPSFSFDPCDFGDPYTKRTHLWGEFVPPLPLFSGSNQPVEPTLGSKMHLLPPSKDRANIRSATPMGFSRAFFEANP